jgi:hypothetical protein
VSPAAPAPSSLGPHRWGPSQIPGLSDHEQLRRARPSLGEPLAGASVTIVEDVSAEAPLTPDESCPERPLIGGNRRSAPLETACRLVPYPG